MIVEKIPLVFAQINKNGDHDHNDHHTCILRYRQEGKMMCKAPEMDCVEAPHGKCHRTIKDIGNVTVASNWHTIVACVDHYYRFFSFDFIII